MEPEPYLGEIRMFSGSYAPAGWLFCDGSSLKISEHEALYSMIQGLYGADQQDTFRLPDLRGRAAVGVADAFPLGTTGGQAEVYLTPDHLPPHTHPVTVRMRVSADQANQKSPAGNYWAVTGSGDREYAESAPQGNTMAASMLEVTVGEQIVEQGKNAPVPLPNLQPYLGVNFIICIEGEYPSPE